MRAPSKWSAFLQFLQSYPCNQVITMEEITAKFASSSKNSLYHYLGRLKNEGIVDNPKYGIYVRKKDVPLGFKQENLPVRTHSTPSPRSTALSQHSAITLATQWSQILRYLQTTPCNQPIFLTEIAEKLQIQKTSLYHYLYQLKKEEILENPKYGTYIRVKDIPNNLKQESPISQKTLSLSKFRSGWRTVKHAN